MKIRDNIFYALCKIITINTALKAEMRAFKESVSLSTKNDIAASTNKLLLLLHRIRITNLDKMKDVFDWHYIS